MKKQRGMPQQTAGVADPVAESFLDVRRACHGYLMAKDPFYRRSSERGTENNQKRRKSA